MPGGWICVVMDFISDAVHFTAKQGGQAAEDLSRAVTALHDNNFVHGDLREQNILVRDGRAFLIDFDWCGTEGQQTYPPFMNHVGVQWASDAGDLLALKKSHDEHFMSMLL
jgi:RIO-like serine/threonine protein kinase